MNVLPCLSACLSLSLFCIHILTAYSTSAIHENCRSEMCTNGEKECRRKREESGRRSGAVTKCSLIILHSLSSHPVSLHPSLIPFCLSSDCIFSARLPVLFTSSLLLASPFPSHAHFLSFSSLLFLVFFLLLLLFLGRREEEWRVTMATASWLQATCRLVYGERERERWRERATEGSLPFTISTFLFINPMKIPKPTVNSFC